MKGIVAGVMLVVASSLATTQAANRVDAPVAAVTSHSAVSASTDALPDTGARGPMVATADARAVENAMAEAFRASDRTARECSDRWSAYCDIADHAAGAVMMQAREKYEAAEFIRDR